MGSLTIRPATAADLPAITLGGLAIPGLLGGAVFIETIFAWPGLGRITLEAIQTEDQYLVMGAVVMASAVLVLGNLVADLLYSVVDPRIRLR